MVKVAVICVPLTTATLLTAIPVPLTPTVAPATKFDPVSVTATLVPCVPEFGAMEFNAGVWTGATTVTVAEPTAEGVAALDAVIVTLPPLGTTAGALYKPAVEMSPTVEFPPATPLTLQFTNCVVELVTVAVNCCDALVTTVAAAGLTVTDTPLACLA